VDIMFLLERLESQIATGTGVPTTRKVLVDKDAILELIDQLRVSVPDEVRAAKGINAEAEQIMERARQEASRITARAQEQATYLIGERGLTEAAQAEGRRIVADASDAADGVRLGADQYAAQILETLETEVRKALAGIEKGIEVLEVRQAELRPEEVGTPDEGSKDLDGWPEAPIGEGEGSPAYVREEDAGQTVPR
jgi:cell division septum initiation protein DivIVA